MIKYILKRLGEGLIVLIILSMVIFILVRTLPSDPMLLYVSQGSLDHLTPEDVEIARHEWGLDLPIWQQYFNWLKDAVQGDLGTSFFFKTSVTSLIAQRLPKTLYLGILAFIFATIIGMLAGTVAALRRGRWQDHLLTGLANIGICLPTFWVAELLMYFFGYKLGWLPLSGFTDPFTDFGMSVKQTIMPLICLTIFDIAGDTRQTRSSMLEVTGQDYIRTAWEKGLNEKTIVKKHILKNALVPIVSLKGISFGYIVGGSVFVETVFAINGIGRLITQAVIQSDYAVIQGVVLMTGVTVIIANLIVDILYVILDPRIRETGV
ncbi:MAG: ABC transporter permease [Parasporobacterium sp.]|nr:ABC transporter permease [Parasporobacterium sp.]